jgi:hypothetical protein
MIALKAKVGQRLNPILKTETRRKDGFFVFFTFQLKIDKMKA